MQPSEGNAFLARYTPGFVSEQLDHLSKCGGMFIAFTWEDTGPQVVASRNVLLYIDSQWRRLHGWHRGPCDVLAFITRNLMELYFWTKRIVQSAELAQQFLNESDVEQQELFKEHLKIEPENDDASLARSLLKVLSNEWTGHRTRFEKTDKYEPLVYKECSKYIHASPWLINNLCRMHDPYVRRELIAYTLHYLVNINHLILASHPRTRFLTESE